MLSEGSAKVARGRNMGYGNTVLLTGGTQSDTWLCTGELLEVDTEVDAEVQCPLSYESHM